MNSKILLISLIAVVLFSGCVGNEAEPLGEEFSGFAGSWSASAEKAEISFTIAEDGTGTYSETISELSDFECAAFAYVDKSSVTFACKGTSLEREFDVTEVSANSLKLSHPEIEEELTFSRVNN